MDLFQDVSTPVEQNNLDNGTGSAGDAVVSPDSSKSKLQLQLPVSCDPPGPGNPAKQMVWIVSLAVFRMFLAL